MPPQDTLKLKWDFSEFFHGLDQYAASVKYAAYDAAVAIGHDGLGRMVQAAPVLTGFLRGSASVHVDGNFLAAGPPASAKGPKPEGKMPLPMTGEASQGKKANSTIILWGVNASYAAKRHELDKPGTYGGGGKFVEGPIKENIRRWMKFFSTRIAQAQGYRS